MSVSINMTITNAGFQAIFNANNTGVELNLTHLQLGSGQRTTDKSETTLVSPIQFQAITAAERPSLNQVRMSAVFPITQTYDICEIGIWAGEPGTSGSVLFAYWASPDGKLVTTAPGVDFVFTHDMTMDQSVADSINVVIDPNASSFLSLLNLHLNDAGDPHSQYLKKTDFSSAITALEESISENTTDSFTSHTNAENPHSQYAVSSHGHSSATQFEAGFMSAIDKAKLDSIERINFVAQNGVGQVPSVSLTLNKSGFIVVQANANAIAAQLAAEGNVFIYVLCNGIASRDVGISVSFGYSGLISIFYIFYVDAGTHLISGNAYSSVPERTIENTSIFVTGVEND